MENPDGHPAANSGVSTDVNENGSNTQMNNDRMTLSRSNREERLKILKERQNEERLKKLEELKTNAIQAAKVREEQDARRRKQFEEFGKKEDERRRQAEERRRHLDEERKVSLQTKWESKKQSLAKVQERNKPIFAFGSCTPRLVDNLVDGCLWKSQYNLNSAKEPHVKSTTSAQDLHSQIMDPDRVFCGRKRTDLTPTLPIRREDGSSRSTSRAGTQSGRVYASMTRLDHGSPVRQGGFPRTSTPSRSKSTTQLPSTGKLTRTEILRQNLVSRGREPSGGTRSGNATPSSRPPSSMSSLMTSSTHSQVHVQMRPRTLATRKSRPISVHVTGVSSSNTTPPSSKTAENLNQLITTRPPVIMKTNPNITVSKGEKLTKNDIPTPPNSAKTLPRKKVAENGTRIKPAVAEGTTNPKTEGKKAEVTKKSSEKPQQIDSSTIKRAKPAAAAAPPKKKEIEKPVDKELEIGGDGSTDHKMNMVSEKVEVVIEKQEQKEASPSPENDQKNDEIAPISVEFQSVTSNQSMGSEQQVEIETFEPEVEVKSLTTTEAESLLNGSELVSFGFGESPSPSQSPEIGKEMEIIFDKSEFESPAASSPEPIGAVLNGTIGVNHKEELVRGTNPFGEDSVNTISSDGAIPMDFSFEGKPKLMTEEDAKAALADKRRLAREAQEKEAARLIEEERLEEERQWLEAQEADRIALIAREMEGERLRVAIEEQNLRELDEKKKQEDDELARQERERDEREAAREAERIRQEMEERLKREEEERLERKRRVEAIMSRTRKTGQDSAKATTPVPEENPSTDTKFSVNGIQHALDQSSTPIAITNLNNYNNNNDFSNTLIDFGDISSSPTPPPQTNNSSSNLINTSLQDLLS